MKSPIETKKVAKNSSQTVVKKASAKSLKNQVSKTSRVTSKNGKSVFISAGFSPLTGEVEFTPINQIKKLCGKDFEKSLYRNHECTNTAFLITENGAFDSLGPMPRFMNSKWRKNQKIYFVYNTSWVRKPHKFSEDHYQ